MNPLHKLAERFGDLPGIGPRQAMRFVYFLLSKNPEYRKELSYLITHLHDDIRICSSCFRHYTKNNSDSTLCTTCVSSRDKTKLLIVARDTDFEVIEKTKAYDGYYFILGGTVPILEPEPDKVIRIHELVKKISDSQIQEIIIAMNANPEGENTEDIIRERIYTLCNEKSITITRLGRGLSTGVELEYSDSETLKNALSGRK